MDLLIPQTTKQGLYQLGQAQVKAVMELLLATAAPKEQKQADKNEGLSACLVCLHCLLAWELISSIAGRLHLILAFTKCHSGMGFIGATSIPLLTAFPLIY